MKEFPIKSLKRRSALVAVFVTMTLAGAAPGVVQIFSVGAFSTLVNESLVIDIDTGAFQIVPNGDSPPSNFDIQFSSGDFIDDISGGDIQFFVDDSFEAVPLGSGVDVNNALTSTIAGSSFSTFGYLTDSDWPPTTTAFIGMRISRDLDSNAVTTDEHFAYIEVTRSSIAIPGFAVEDTAQTTITTAPIPEPSAVTLGASAVLAFFVFKRRRRAVSDR
ncbi:MAG: hypothetical protein AAGA58_18450 [Verrucomicrobiota bacterium]